MKITANSILLLLLTIQFSSCNKENNSNDFVSTNSGLYASPLFSASQLTRYDNVPFSTRPNFMGIQFTDDLTMMEEQQQAELTIYMDVVVPPNASIHSRQPLMVLIHGGGFLQGSKIGLTNNTLSYASAGYVSATVNYRLTEDNYLDADLRTLAVLHALEDVQNAIRFLKANAEIFYIDTTRIAVSGGSAGGGLSLALALGADEIDELVSDYVGISARIHASFPSGATLTADSLIDFSYLEGDATDAPVMLFHNSLVDPATGATWQDAMITQTAIENSGNECILIAQPATTHTVSLHVGGPYWETMRPFLWRHLRLHEIVEN